MNIQSPPQHDDYPEREPYKTNGLSQLDDRS